MSLSKPELLKAYRKMRELRVFEERLQAPLIDDGLVFRQQQK